MDDPRQILAEAGVECVEVDELFAIPERQDMAFDNVWGFGFYDMGDGGPGDAILALSRLVAKYKWQRDYLADNCADGYWTDDGWFPSEDVAGVIADLERRWSERK